MSGEKIGERSGADSEKWLNDEQMRGRGAGLHRYAAGGGIEFLQGAGKGMGIAGEMRTGGIGLIFARARDGKLDQRCRDGSDDQHKERGQPSAAGAAVASTEAAK